MSANILLTTDDTGEKRITIIKVLPNPSIIAELKKEQMNLKLKNDRFSYYETKAEYPIEVSIIDQATPKDIAKYFPTTKFELITERYSDYQRLTQPFAEKSDKTWIYNILDGKAEQERILFDDPEFILLPNGNWSGKVEEADQLHCLAIVKQRDILSLRDLTDEHYNLLDSILENSFKTIEAKYGIAKSRLRAYVHYHPTFWHLHIHFKLVDNISPHEFDRIHSVFSILQNIQIQPHYYQMCGFQISVPQDRVALYTPQ
jgi:m7GpppX diphosphatase